MVNAVLTILKVALASKDLDELSFSNDCGGALKQNTCFL
jgi:hypothetical protein